MLGLALLLPAGALLDAARCSTLISPVSNRLDRLGISAPDLASALASVPASADDEHLLSALLHSAAVSDTVEALEQPPTCAAPSAAGLAAFIASIDPTYKASEQQRAALGASVRHLAQAEDLVGHAADRASPPARARAAAALSLLCPSGLTLPRSLLPSLVPRAAELLRAKRCDLADDQLQLLALDAIVTELLDTDGEGTPAAAGAAATSVHGSADSDDVDEFLRWIADDVTAADLDDW